MCIIHLYFYHLPWYSHYVFQIWDTYVVGTVSLKRETFQREHVNYEKHYFIISKTHKSEGVFFSIWLALAVINIYR